MVHSFDPDEIPWKSRQAGLEVVCSSTMLGFARNPQVDVRSYHRQGCLAYVLKRLQDR